MTQRLFHRNALMLLGPDGSGPPILRTPGVASSREERALTARNLGKTFLPVVPSVADPNAIQRVIDDNEMSLPGAKTLLAVSGPNGVGKSTLIRQWSYRKYLELTRGMPLGTDGLPQWIPPHPPTSEARSGCGYSPVVVVNLPADSKVADLNKSILRFVGKTTTGTVHDLTARVLDAVDEHGIQVLIIDDAHFLRTHLELGRNVLNHIKHLNTELGERDASIVLVGANLEDNELVADSQIGARLRILSIQPITVDTASEQRLWQRQLRLFEQSLHPYLPELEIGTFSEKFAPLIWRRTQGYVGETARLLRTAACIALQKPVPRVTKTDLKQIELHEDRMRRERNLESEHRSQSTPSGRQ